MKRFFSCFTALMLFFAIGLIPNASAAAYEASAIQSGNVLEDNITVERTIVVHDTSSNSSSTASAVAATSTKNASITDTYKNNGVTIAVVTLNVTFSYTGSTSSVVSTSSSHTVYEGWTYSSEKTSSTGGTASLSATLKKGISSVAVSMSLTCSKSGSIS